jgi:integrase
MRKRHSSSNRILTVLKAALNFAKSKGKIASDVAWKNVKPYEGVDAPKVRFLSDDEVTKLVSKCEPDFANLVKGALLTGARYGELTALTVKEFEADDRRILIAQSKNGESRYVDLNESGIGLFTQITANRDAEEKVFLRSNGKPWKKSEQFRPMNDACKAAEIEDVTFHILRHTYASHCLKNGMPMPVLAKILGHKDQRITARHYAHVCDKWRKEMVERNAPSFGFQSAQAGPVLMKRKRQSA